MTPWTLPASDWPTVAAMLELTTEPWPEGLALHDLAFLRWEVQAGHRPRLPGRGFLAARWGWTRHQARAFLAAHPPARRQPNFDPTTLQGADPVIGEPTVTSSPPAGRRDGQADPLPRAFLEAHPPARRQPDASPGTGQPGLSADSRQPDASGTPDPVAAPPPHTPPLISTPDPDPTSVDRSEGVEGETTPTLTPTLTAQVQELPEARAFLRVWTRWRHHPKAPVRWKGGAADALGWFLELLGADPTSKIGRALARLDVVASLEAWDAWLSDRADEHGTPGTKGRAKFPRGWKNALRTWIVNQVKYGRNLRPEAEAATRRRGAWAGRPTAFDVTTTAPPTTGAVPCTTPTDPPGDPDALDRF